MHQSLVRSFQVAAFQTLCKQADIVVADEGHQIKNPKTRISVAMNSFHTMRRVALTGYPLQNNMDEYYTMIQWCKNDILDHSQYFHQTWAAPIAAGICMLQTCSRPCLSYATLLACIREKMPWTIV